MPTRVANGRGPTEPSNEEVRVRTKVIKHMAVIIAVVAGMGGSATPAHADTRDAVRKQRTHIKDRVRSQTGTRYSYGGSSPGGYDCSGLTRWTFGDHGANLPHSSMDQFNLGKRDSHRRIWKRRNLRRGDLVFHKTTSARVGHVGIYIGKGKFVSATSSEGVRVRSLYDPYYWGPRWVGATRVPALIGERRR